MDSRLLARLANPACYPGSVDAVEIRQTHLSVVCLAGDYAYKLKKPVRFPFVDFSTRELRRHFCEEEVRLNRRLCPGLYLGVAPLLRTAEGGWTFRGAATAGEGQVEEWAVRMRRLPEEKLLHHELAENRVTEDQIREVARIMARFHGQSRPSPEVIEAGSPAKKRQAILANFDLLESGAALGFDLALLEAVRARAEADLEQWMPLMEERSRSGRVVDGHGDLHARNICLTEPPVIFDCIEFRPEFRCGDVAVENAFLVMDLTYRGHPELAQVYLDTYITESGDADQRRLMPLFLSYRAMVRAKVAALSGMDPDIAVEERRHARESVARHLQLAAAGALSQDRILLLACGLPGTGKSHFCHALAERSGWPVVSSDRVRKELAGVPPEHRLPGEFYEEVFSARTYAEVLRQIWEQLPTRSTLADASFARARLRAQAGAACRRVGGRPSLVWIDADEAVVARRLGLRKSDATAVSDANWEVYQRLRASFEPPGEAEGLPVLRIDGTAGADQNVDRVLTWLLRGTPEAGEGRTNEADPASNHAAGRASSVSR